MMRFLANENFPGAAVGHGGDQDGAPDGDELSAVAADAVQARGVEGEMIDEMARSGAMRDKGRYTKRLVAKSAALVILLALLQLHEPQTAAGASAKDEISLVYNANAKLCGAFVSLMNQLHRRHPKAVYFSEVQDEFFGHAGFSQPKWIEGPDEQIQNYGNPGMTVPLFRRQGNGYWTGGAFFRADVANDGKERLVLVEHRSFGHNGGYQGIVWILKPGLPYRTKEAVQIRNGLWVADVDPEVVDLVIDFNGLRTPYASTKVPNTRIAFSGNTPPSEDAVGDLRIEVGMLAQDAFVFDGSTYFSVGTPVSGSGLIYQVTPQMTAEVLCIALDQPDLDAVRRIERTSK